MGDFKKRGGFGGGRSGGGFRGGEGRGSSFGGGRGGRPGNRDFRESQMFSATCADCQKTCEVPFRPTGEKPVYCSYCFTKHKEDGSNDYPRRESNDRPRRDERPSFSSNRGPSMDRAPRPQADNGALVSDLKRQIETVNNKLDKLMEMLKKGDSQEVKKSSENKVDAKELSTVVKKAVVAVVPKKVVAVAKKPAKVVAKAVKKGKK